MGHVWLMIVCTWICFALYQSIDNVPSYCAEFFIAEEFSKLFMMVVYSIIACCGGGGIVFLFS